MNYEIEAIGGSGLITQPFYAVNSRLGPQFVSYTSVTEIINIVPTLIQSMGINEDVERKLFYNKQPNIPV